MAYEWIRPTAWNWKESIATLALIMATLPLIGLWLVAGRRGHASLY